ncbi:unnamed protein product [Acanthoscelides obtectus]|uniref:Uncharacterized protein n=1 Tax=Acanthoscelides obtectus TaxID=200917 RepID=A0A9P0KSJ7_ACAOB|nr:unnamed protein product [Acanthoscelides obtectus]CAK1632844.1 hypothetical protein AOBTE_LOCUS7761 [Acanthoscelides obtectus]
MDQKNKASKLKKRVMDTIKETKNEETKKTKTTSKNETNKKAKWTIDVSSSDSGTDNDKTS